MKLDSFVKQLDSASRLIEFLEKDKSGDIYLLPELAEKLQGLKISSSSLRVGQTPKLSKYTIVVKTNRATKTFYGNPDVINRARQYAVNAEIKG